MSLKLTLATGDGFTASTRRDGEIVVTIGKSKGTDEQGRQRREVSIDAPADVKITRNQVSGEGA